MIGGEDCYLPWFFYRYSHSYLSVPTNAAFERDFIASGYYEAPGKLQLPVFNYDKNNVRNAGKVSVRPFICKY